MVTICSFSPIPQLRSLNARATPVLNGSKKVGDFMNLLIALALLYTPLGYLGLLYLVFYFRDLSRFTHPFTQQGDESWGDVLLYLGVTK